MSKWKYDEKADTRNYDLEARELVRSLRGAQLYDMYGIVNKQLQRSVSPKRERELQAVKKAIENYPSIDKYKSEPLTVDVVDVNGEQVLQFTEEQMKALKLKAGDTIVWNINDETGEVSFTVKDAK